MAEVLAILMMYFAGAAVVYGVWRGRATGMISVNGRYHLRAWHIAMWLAASVWGTAVFIVLLEHLSAAVVATVALLPGAALLLIGRRLHHR